MNEEKINNAILTLETLIDCYKEDGTYYNAQKEWEALEVFKQLQNNWNELKKWLEECLNEIKQNDVYDRTSYENGEILATESTIAKMQEMEQVK